MAATHPCARWDLVYLCTKAVGPSSQRERLKQYKLVLSRLWKPKIKDRVCSLKD